MSMLLQLTDGETILKGPMPAGSGERHLRGSLSGPERTIVTLQ